MKAAELIAEFADWKLFLLALVIYSICPQLLLRLLVLVYDKGDLRRQELLAELYEVPRRHRPFWVVEQIETAFFDGVVPRVEWALTGRVIHRWKLGSGVERNTKYPETFWIPSEEEKDSIIAGDLVKLMFEMKCSCAERMWVRVSEVGHPKMVGTLANQPVGIPRLDFGDTVKFKRDHIIDIEIDDGDEHQVVEGEGGERVNRPDDCQEHRIVAV